MRSPRIAFFDADGQDVVGMANECKARFKALLDGYNGRQTASSRDLIQIADHLLKGFKIKHEQGRKLQETTADDFNLLETLQISAEEMRHSMMLAWLLGREATHAQGKRGFRLFLKHLKHLGLKGKYADTNYWVIPEKRGAESRVDLEVAARGQFIIHIENKIYAGEGDDQTKKEWRDLLYRAGKLDVPSASIHGLYLTLDGHPPTSPEFQAISWRQIADVFDHFSKKAKAEQVGLFAAHYAGALRGMTFELTQNNENENQIKS